jgi:hypothetical protein
MTKNILLAALCLTFSVSLFSQTKSDYKLALIGFYNLENLFDTLDNPITNDADFLPSGRLLWDTPKYISKQANMAKVISWMGLEQSPDGLALLGVSEIENRKVLEDLVVQEAIKKRNYQIVHFDSPDERGIDCALLYQPKYFQLLGAKAYPVNLQRDGDTLPDLTRDIVYVSGKFMGEPLHVMVGHWPSRRGGEAASAWMRARSAGVCRAIADSLLTIDPNAKIVIMGDLNDDPNNKSLTQVLKAKGEVKEMEDPKDLYNTMYDHYKNGNGTLAYRDSWNLFDQIIVSKGFVHKKAAGWQLFKSFVYKEQWMLQDEGAFKGYPFRTFVGDMFINGYSDHFPTYICVIKK